MMPPDLQTRREFLCYFYIRRKRIPGENAKCPHELLHTVQVVKVKGEARELLVWMLAGNSLLSVALSTVQREGNFKGVFGLGRIK